jgi:hypothetical protein
MEANDIRPWFRDELVRILMGINLASQASMTADRQSDGFRRGYILALASLAVVIGVSPERIFLSEDLRLLNESQEMIRGS